MEGAREEQNYVRSALPRSRAVHSDYRALMLTGPTGLIEDDRYHGEDLLCLREESMHLQEV